MIRTATTAGTKSLKTSKAMRWLANKGSNDNPSPARDTARKNFEQGKSPRQTRNDLSKQKAREQVKPVKPDKPDK